MKIAKVLIAGVAVTVFNMAVGFVTCGGIFSWVYKLEPTSVWKPMAGAPSAFFQIGSLTLSVVLALVYALINKGLPGKNKFAKGCAFGLIVWAVGMVPGMLSTHEFMTVATTVIIYWMVLELVKAPIQGMIIAAIYGE